MIKINFVEQSLRFKNNLNHSSTYFPRGAENFSARYHFLPPPLPTKIDFLSRDGAENFSTLARNKHQSRKPKKVNAVT